MATVLPNNDVGRIMYDAQQNVEEHFTKVSSTFTKVIQDINHKKITKEEGIQIMHFAMQRSKAELVYDSIKMIVVSGVGRYSSINRKRMRILK